MGHRPSLDQDINSLVLSPHFRHREIQVERLFHDRCCCRLGFINSSRQ